MYPNQGGYQPHQPPPSYGQPSQYSGPPPAKKPRGNPVITRYPPPPGYRGPAQPHPQFQPPPQTAWQQPPPPQGFAYGGYPGYQQPQFQQPPAQYPGYPYQQPQHPLPAYPPPQAYQAPQWQAPPQISPNAQAGAFQPPQARNPRRTASQSQHRNASGSLLDGNGEVMPPLDDSLGSEESFEEDFDGECYFARYPEEINPDLSLGIIEWKAPLPTRRALPSTFDEAELEALAPRKPPPVDEQSVSDYFTIARREEAFLSVRQTDGWHEIKDSLIFREFPAVCRNLITLQELIAQYRNRFDAAWASEDEDMSRSPTPDLSRGPTPSRTVSGHSMEVDHEHATAVPSKEMAEAPSQDPHGYLDGLEQALHNNSRRNAHQNQHNNPRPNNKRSHSRASSVANHGRNGSISHFRANSVFSNHSRAGSVNHHSRASSVSHSRALPKVRDQAQEDILASLGVEGSPSQVYETPGPAFGPPPTTAEKEKERHSRANSIGSGQVGSVKSGSGHAPPFAIPPPPPGRPPFQSQSQYFNQQRRASRDPWAGNGHNSSQNGNRPTSRPTSASSHRTAAGSDFGDIMEEENEATPKAAEKKPGVIGQGRKRSFSDLKKGGGRGREQDGEGEETPRARKMGRRGGR
ncbi:unnamed protein product [Zymoseptoria tritici ST99CH_1A5]|uniref:Uncharacterized protein n=2 Tax=Zymoseptoria tritici TaxID=1047171 RepID=A0A1X7S2P3_ZYMT9|nr:unnamed protein product [Zymoseptoria tritici ST99CH_3D7]SMY27579.1 unnamed protein product [Zymoseptoria tritici ST99CH_1A5]